MESQDFGHEHPLLFSEEHINQSETPQKCSRCGEVMSGPSFSCAECEFYLHKECAEAPSQINHPFHGNHPLCLLPKPKYDAKYFICEFCGEKGETFDYHCSDCRIDLHIKCALFTYNIAEKKVGDLKGIACKDPSIFTENCIQEVGSPKCLGCWEPLFDSIYSSLGSGLNLHKKCAELPVQIDHPCHIEHPLILQFSGHIFSCVICQDDEQGGLFYSCLHCKFGIHIACLSPPSNIKDKGHPHPFTLFFRLFSFTCDACGIEENCVPYMCSNCNLLIHKKCISLPRIIKFIMHKEHPILYTYSLRRHESKNWDCKVCHKEVNTKYGSYYCSKPDCHYIVHVNCALKPNWHVIIESDGELKDDSTLMSDISVNSITVIERNEEGEATKIEHFSHEHTLMLGDETVKDDKYCDGCALIISDSFYYCSQCIFFLHKLCAEHPKVKHLWFHDCWPLLILTSDNIFKCLDCGYVCNGFAYKCDECREHICLRCVILDTLTSDGHKDPLFYHFKYEGQCNACGKGVRQGYKCKECNFVLDWKCAILPSKARHKCDKHLLELTYRDDNIYSESHFCDICEEDRNPNHWFYHCTICDNSLHVKCVLGRYPFMKLGRLYKKENHPHPLTFVKKTYYYPKCFECGKPCEDLALECLEPGCEYITHWDCIASPDLIE